MKGLLAQKWRSLKYLNESRDGSKIILNMITLIMMIQVGKSSKDIWSMLYQRINKS